MDYGTSASCFANAFSAKIRQRNVLENLIILDQSYVAIFTDDSRWQRGCEVYSTTLAIGKRKRLTERYSFVQKKLTAITEAASTLGYPTDYNIY